MVLFQPDEICHYKCNFIQYITIADGDSDGSNLHSVQYRIVYSDFGKIPFRNGGGRLYNGDSSDTHNWRLPDAEPGNYRPLPCQDI